MTVVPRSGRVSFRPSKFVWDASGEPVINHDDVTALLQCALTTKDAPDNGTTAIARDPCHRKATLLLNSTSLLRMSLTG